MNKLPVVLAFLVLPFCLSAAQEGKKGVTMSSGTIAPDYSFVKKTQPWLVSGNTSLLHLSPVGKMSIASAGLKKYDGGLIDVHESDDCIEGNFFTESYVKVSDRMTFYGRLSYDYFSGKNMGGPVLMDPYYNSENFVESTDTTLGNKTKELYTLCGGISYRLSDRWSLGGKVYYQTGNYAKLKDPRHKNTWADINVSAGASFAAGDNAVFGLNAVYRRTIESLSAKIYGATTAKYYYLIDYGGYFGTTEIIDGDNLHVTTSGKDRNMYNAFYGASLQADFALSDKVRFFNELSFLMRDGYFGNKGTGEIRFADNEGMVLSYKGILSVNNSGFMQQITLDASYQSLTNLENSFSVTTVPGENQKVVYYGSQETLDKNTLSAGLSYDGFVGVSSLRPSLSFGVDLSYYMHDFTATTYPFYRKQNVNAFAASLHADKNFLHRANMFTAGARIDYRDGGGIKNEDGLLASASGSPKKADSYLNRNFEYLTAGRAGAELSFRYSRFFGKAAKTMAYAEISDSFVSLVSKPEYLYGRYRNILSITLGCSF